MFLMSFVEFYKQSKTSQYADTAMFLHEFRVPEIMTEFKHGTSKRSFHEMIFVRYSFDYPSKILNY